MNIFATDTNPHISATNLDSKRVVKMVLESAQMLSTAINEHGRGRVTGPYKSTHINHPANVWARETRANYIWLFVHFMSLCQEYTSRYGKTHKCQQYAQFFDECRNIIPKGSQTPFANCAAHSGKGISYKHIKPTTLAYQMYLVDRWNTDTRPPEWDMRGFNTKYPSWLRKVQNTYIHEKDPTFITLYGENSNIGRLNELIGLETKQSFSNNTITCPANINFSFKK